MVKKIVILLLCVVLVGVVGCDQSDDVLTDSVVSSISKEAESIKKSYMEKFEAELTAEDVKYDMPNSLDQNFYLYGYAYLSDYYNYGFDNDIEKTHFVLRVESITSTDKWYIYCDREVFKRMFEDAKSKERIYIFSACMIPEKYYEKGQGYMAMLVEAEWS